jgi:hypothetical protein
MNRNQDAGTSQTVLQSAQRLPALMDSVADLIGDIINHPGLRLALQQIAHGAGNLGQAIGEQLADRLSDISAVQGGGRQQTQGFNSPIQSVEQHMAIESALNGVGLHFLDTGSPERENVAQQEIETKIGEMIDLLYNQLEEEFSPENRRTFLQNFLIELHILDQPPLGNAWAGYEEDTLEQLNNIRDVFINAKERASHNLTALNQIYLMLGRLLQDRQDLLRNWIPLLHPRWPHSAIWLANNLQRRADRQEGLCDPRNLNLQSPGRRSPAAR